MNQSELSTVPARRSCQRFDDPAVRYKSPTPAAGINSAKFERQSFEIGKLSLDGT